MLDDPGGSPAGVFLWPGKTRFERASDVHQIRYAHVRKRGSSAECKGIESGWVFFLVSHASRWPVPRTGVGAGAAGGVGAAAESAPAGREARPAIHAPRSSVGKARAVSSMAKSRFANATPNPIHVRPASFVTPWNFAAAGMVRAVPVEAAVRAREAPAGENGCRAETNSAGRERNAWILASVNVTRKIPGAMRASLAVPSAAVVSPSHLPWRGESARIRVRRPAISSVSRRNREPWLRPCTTQADCRLLGTFCPAELDASLPSYCFAIRCGADDPNIAWFGQNGDVFGACDPLHYGVLSETPEGGTCVPDTNSERATCLRDGTSTTTCRRSPLGGFREEYACAPGFSCEQLFEGWGESCNTDADCGKESLLCVEGLCFPMPCRQDRDCGTNSYCSSDRICEPLGACIEICNAGTLGASAGPHADCSGGKVCFEHPYNERSSSSSEILGVCVSP